MFLVPFLLITSMKTTAGKVGEAFVSQTIENVKGTNRVVISTGPLNFDDYEMAAETASPQIHDKMNRFYQYISKRRQARPIIITSENVRSQILQKKKWAQPLEIRHDYDYDLNGVREKKQVSKGETTSRKPDEHENKFENHDSLLREYLLEREENNKTFTYKQESEDESLLKEAIGNIMKPAELENCTEDMGYGLSAVKCINVIHGKKQTHLAIKLFLIWSGSYAAIAFCLWCNKGWCCCCCPCKFCAVDQRLDTIQRFIAHNPPGEWNHEGTVHEYEPTADEVYLYEKISRAFIDI